MTFEVVLFNDSEIKFGFTRSAGAHSLSSALKEHGYETLVVSYSVAINWEKFKNLIDLSVGENTLVVGFSVSWFDSQSDMFPEHDNWESKSISTNFQRKHIDPYINYIKSVNPNVKVIVGGFTAHKYINEKLIDNVFIGYSESQVVDYVNSLSKKGLRRIFNKIINYDVKAKNYNFNASTIQYSEYDLINPAECMFIEFARGCIFKCSFCSFPLIGSKTIDYLKYKEVVYNELLTNYEKWGITGYFIVDDTFNDSVEKLKIISEVIDELPFKPQFGAYVRIDLLASHPEMAQLIKNIGIKTAMYGLETWNTETAKIIKKGGSHERKIKALKAARECWGDEISVHANLIVGLPNDTTESFEKFFVWYEEEGFKYIDHVAISPLHLSPNNDQNPYSIYLSDIDTNKQEYGYKFNNLEKIDNNIDGFGGVWEKLDTDTGDIRNRNQAGELCNLYNQRLYSIQQRKIKPLDHSPRPGKSIGLLGGLKEQFKIDSNSPEKIIYKIFELDYYPRLIKLLTDRKNNDKRN
jgi:hypothetical protein